MNAAHRAAKSLWVSTPLLLGVILLIGLVTALVPEGALGRLFSGGWFDPVIGAGVGSVLAGNPVTSYVLGGELLEQGVGLVAVTAFIVAWVTVGVVQLPAETALLGRRFAIARNAAAFLASIVIAVLIGVVR